MHYTITDTHTPRTNSVLVSPQKRKVEVVKYVVVDSTLKLGDV